MTTIEYTGEGFFERADGVPLRVSRRFPAVVVPNELFADLSLRDVDQAVATALASLAAETDDAFINPGELRHWWPSDFEHDHLEKYVVGLRDFHFRFPGDGSVELVVETGKDQYRDAPWDWIKPLVAPALDRRGAKWLGFGYPDDDPVGDDQTEVRIHLAQPACGCGADLLAFGQELLQLIQAGDGGELSLASAADLVRTGFGHLLEGQAESQWLDAKSAPYRLEKLGGRLELAKDVAAFANANGGLIVIGARAARERNGERITTFGTLPLELVDLKQVRDVLADRVFPTVTGLDVRAVEREAGRGAVMVHVPPQSSSAQPFLVRGADTGTQLDGVMIALPVRHGQDTIWADLSTIHGFLTAGRLALRLIDGPPDGLPHADADSA